MTVLQALVCVPIGSRLIKVFCPFHQKERHKKMGCAVSLHSGTASDLPNSASKRHELLCSLASEGSTEKLAKMIEELQQEDSSNSFDVDIIDTRISMTPLMCASIAGKVDCVRLLLESGSKVDYQAFLTGKSALMLAAGKGHTQIIELLVQKRANLSLQCNDGMTAIHWATSCVQSSALKLLLRYCQKTSGSNRKIINIQAYNGWTACHIAARGGHVKLLSYLIQGGGDVNLKSIDNKTCLDLAFQNKKTMPEATFNKIVDVLKHGSNSSTDSRILSDTDTDLTPSPLNNPSNDTDSFSNDPNIDHALFNMVARGDVKQLIKRIAMDPSCVNQRDMNSDTPLFWAVCNGRAEVVDLLLKNGANPSMTDSQGFLPIEKNTFLDGESTYYKIQNSLLKASRSM